MESKELRTYRRDALLGREETAALIQAQFDRLMPSMYLAYAGLVLLFLTSGIAVLTKRTVLPRWMFALHIIVFQLIFVLIPDIRQALGVIFAIAFVVCAKYTEWCVYAYRRFSYDGERKLSKQIIDGTAEYITLPEGVTNTSFRHGDAVKLDFPDESFDAVTSNYVYHNISGKNKQELLLETLRVLKKGGTFAIHDLMSPRRYGDMQAFVSKLKSMGYKEVTYMDISKNYRCSEGSDAAIILMLGSGGSNALTKGVSKWLVKQGVNVLSLGPDKGEAGYHSFPLERVAEAIEFLKAQGSRRLGVLGASITTIPALTAAARFSDITLTIAVSPCDYVLQGFAQGKRDGCKEWPVSGESMLTWCGAPIPYVDYAYQHPDYWRTVQEETKGSGNMLAARKVFNDTEAKTPLTDEVMIPVENIRGHLLLIGCEDDCLWPTARYIRRMDERLKSREHDCTCDAAVYEYGTHYAFPESMLRQIIPVFPDFLIGRAFLSAREHPKECLQTREDIDRRMKNAIKAWMEEKQQ